MACGIYCFLNLVNGKRYVGSSCDIKHRRMTHLSRLRRGVGERKFQRAWDKYGERNFAFSIIEEAPRDQLFDKERFWILHYKSVEDGYNITDSPEPAGARLTDETKARIAAALKGIKKTATHVEKVRLALTGRPQTRERRELQSKLLKGKPWSEARRQALALEDRSAAGKRSYETKLQKYGHNG